MLPGQIPKLLLCSRHRRRIQRHSGTSSPPDLTPPCRIMLHSAGIFPGACSNTGSLHPRVHPPLLIGGIDADVARKGRTLISPLLSPSLRPGLRYMRTSYHVPPATAVSWSPLLTRASAAMRHRLRRHHRLQRSSPKKKTVVPPPSGSRAFCPRAPPDRPPMETPPHAMIGH
ncbi:hypothetical protein COCNU_scaffold037883G000010 [Cocos nucifera]|nr:hypothetical protein [Cocos nucifera]